MEETITSKEKKFTSVAEMFADNVFRENLKGVIREFKRTIPSATLIKRHPFHRLVEAGKWDADGLIKVYTEYYIDKTKHYPTAVREFATSIISTAARKTIIYYKNLENLDKPL